MAEEVAEFAFEATDFLVDKTFDKLPTRIFGKSSEKTSRKERKRNEKCGTNPNKEQWSDQSDHHSQDEFPQPLSTRGTRDYHQPRSDREQYYNRPGYTSQQTKSLYDERTPVNREFSSPQRPRSAKVSRRDQRQPASAREQRSREHHRRSDRAYDSDDAHSKSVKSPTKKAFKVLALGAVAGGLVIGALGSSALESRRRKRKEEDEAWKEKYGEDSGSEVESDEDGKRQRQQRNRASQQYHEYQPDGTQEGRRRSMGAY